LENRYAITLDFKQKSVFHVNFVQGNINTSVLEFRIVDGGQPVDISNQEVTVAFFKPDGTLVIQDSLTGVSVLDGSNGRLECVLSSNTLAAAGIVKGEVNFDSVGTKLSTAQFIFNVTVSLDNGDILTSINELPKLDAKLIDIQAQYNDDSTQWNSDVNNIIAEADNKMIETESTRQLALAATDATNQAITNAQNATSAANNATINMINSTPIWKAPVANLAALTTTYPTAVKGWCAQTLDNGNWYMYSGTAWEYKGNFSLNGGATVMDLTDVNLAQAKLVRSARHSGVVDFKPIVTGSTTNLNSITIPETTYSVHGQEITMPETVLTLPDPPTEGTREDLAFLETYFPIDGNGYKMAGRYRTVAGVDFNAYPHDGFCVYPGIGGNLIVQAQGGNISPLNHPERNTQVMWAFFSKEYRKGTIATGKKIALNDVGLYVAGDGSLTSKSTLQTYDGYSYALPVARIPRRNSGGFSVENPSGARGYVAGAFFPATANGGILPTISDIGKVLMNVDIGVNLYNEANVGDYLCSGTFRPYQIVAKNGTTVNVLVLSNGFGNSSSVYYLYSTHPQGFYSNVIAKDDITDLRHRVQAQYNYQYELAKADGQFNRGELSPKKMMKVYHGIPKSEIDEHTVFYASLDGTTVPEFPVGSSAMNLGTGSFKPMPTGSGYKFNGDSVTQIDVSGIDINKGSIEFWLDANSLKYETSPYPTWIEIYDSSGNVALQVIYVLSTGELLFKEYYSDVTPVQAVLVLPKGIPHIAIRVSFDNSKLYIRINGQVTPSQITRSASGTRLVPSKLLLGRLSNQPKSIISDIHISNIDRGNLFPNLPPDFISGDAIIMPAYTEQRKVHSEAQMIQTVNAITKGAGTGHTRGITDTQATPGVWASGDTIKVTGMAGELISGVIDTDTALARIKTTAISTNVISLGTDTDMSKFSVNDLVTIWVQDFSIAVTSGATITAVDVTNKTITLNVTKNVQEGYLVFETTASSSVPLVKFSGGTVAGAWTNLGTNQAILTFGTNATLTNQDIQIDHSLIMPAGQPALTVPTTTTLGGEAGFRIPYAKQTITSDYKDKVSGSSWACPNVAKTGSKIVANNPAPDTFTDELATSEYVKMGVQDGTVTTFSTSVNGEQACILLSFDLIKIAERKLGCKIPGKTKAGKVAWLENNLASIKCGSWIYGSSVSGYKATLTLWNSASNIFDDWAKNNLYHTNSYPTNRTSSISTNLQLKGFISNEGTINYIAYADPSDGVTPSVINVDYASLDIKFADKIVNSFKLVNGTLAVRDDFAGKVAGSVVENPNVVKRTGQTTLYTPSQFITEEGNTEYSQISSLDGTLRQYIANTSGFIAQMLYSYNLIREFEDKYGPIPAIDKVQWLKDNLASIVCNWWGFGANPPANSPYGQGAYACLRRWSGSNWEVSNQYELNGVSAPTKAYVAIPASYISTDGFVYALAYTGASDGVTPSAIYTDYCNIELTLKAQPAGYDRLVPENPRRDAGMSAILDVRKETKEVQSVFPYTNEYLLSTYSEYIEAPTPISANTDVTILAEIPEFLITDLSSAVGYKQGTHHWMNLAHRVGQDKLDLAGELGFSSVPFAPDSVGVNVGAKITVPPNGYLSNYTIVVGLKMLAKPLVQIMRFLVKVDGELKILILSKYVTNGELSTSGYTGFVIPISGKPLTKELDGLVRAGTLGSTAWKTSPLVAQGFVDKATGQLITT